MDIEQFRNPDLAYRGVTLWMLNDRLEGDELERQLAGFRRAGFGAVITRTFDGLLTPYLGEEWMALLERIVRAAKRLGMKVWFQAGYMPGGIPELRPEHRQDVLTALPPDTPPEEGDVVVATDDAYAYAERRLEHALDLINADAVRAYLKQAYEEVWFERFGAEFGRTIEAIWVDEPHFRPGLLPWSEGLHERFERQWGYRVRDHVPSLFRRVGDYRRVRHHYWRTVLEMLIAGYFEPVGEWCRRRGVAFSGHLMGEDTLAAQTAWTAACMPLYEYMQTPGIDHLTLSLGWSHGETGRAGGLPFILTPKQCSSAAHQVGRQVVLAEMYGVSTEGITFRDRKRIGDWFALLGINYRCLHGSFYSLRGRRKRVYVPHLSHQQPWWDENRLVADYFARVGYALRQGSFGADVLVLHPVESAWCLHDRPDQAPGKPPRPPADLVAMNESLVRLSENLMRAHRPFDYGDERLMARHGTVVDGRLRVGQMAYRAVVLPPLITLRRTTFDLLMRFADAGGALLAVGDLPDRIDGAEDAAIGQLKGRVRRVENSPAALAVALEEAAPAAYRLTAPGSRAGDVWVHERRDGSRRILLLANVNAEDAAEVELWVRGGGTAQEWDLATGEVRALPQRSDGEGTLVALHFPPGGSHLVVVEDGKPERPQLRAPVLHRPRRRPVESVQLAPPWRIERHDPNALVLDFCQVSRGGGPFTDPVPMIALKEMLSDHEGPVTLRYRFRADALPRKALLVVEEADRYAIRVNGTAVRYAGLPCWLDRSFLPVDVTECVREGDNVVELARNHRPLERPRMNARFENLHGVELEPVYVIGDFGVRGALSAREARPRCVRYAPEFVLTQEPRTTRGDLVADGYPFLAGKLSLLSTVELRAAGPDRRALLRLAGMDACLARVCVNGRDAGAITWPPYEVDVTECVRDGANTVEIELTGTLRNVIGPFHRPEGEADGTWGEWHWRGWTAPDQEGQWYETRDEALNAWTDDYFLVPFGLPGAPRIDYVRAASTPY